MGWSSSIGWNTANWSRVAAGGGPASYDGFAATHLSFPHNPGFGNNEYATS
jgi:hypothetical protein